MRIHLRTLGYGAGVLLGLFLTTAVQGQTSRPGVHRMEINNGSRVTVRYFSTRLSPGEASTVRDLERAENESFYVASLLELKRQYVSDERYLEAQRRFVQQQLYGVTVAGSTGGSYGYGGLGYTQMLAGLGSGDLANLSYAYGRGTYLPTYAIGYGAGYGGVYGGLGTTGALSRTLAANFVDDSTLKAGMTQVIARDSTDAHAAEVERDLDRAVAVAGGSPTLRTALNLPPAREAYMRPVASDAAGPVTVVLSDGTKIVGSRMEETKEWTTIYTRSGKTRVRPTDVKRIIEGAEGGVVPAN